MKKQNGMKEEKKPSHLLKRYETWKLNLLLIRQQIIVEFGIFCWLTVSCPSKSLIVCSIG